MTDHNYSFGDLVRKVFIAIHDVDEQVLSSDYIQQLGLKQGPSDDPGPEPIALKLVSFDCDDPESHFANLDDIQLWEKYFAFLTKEWSNGRVDNFGLTFALERLRASATELDLYGPLLVAKYEGVRNVPPRRPHGIKKRMTVLNGFLYSAEVALEAYYISTKTTPSLRQRRLVIKRDASEPIQDSNDIRRPPNDKEPEETLSSRRWLRKLFSAFISNSTMIACVMLFTLASAILSAYAYDLAIQEPKDTGWDSPEFYSTVSNALMQLLGLYVTILPVLRHKDLQSSYNRWSWGLAGLSFIAPFIAIGYFRRGPDASQIVLFVGSAIQSTIILQLIWALDNIERKRK